MNIETISAITLRVASMQTSVRFYRDVLGMEVLYSGEIGGFLPAGQGRQRSYPQFRTASCRDSVGASHLLRAGRG